ncbi:MAG: pseudoazurin [Pseudomonadota bacterium]
MNFNFSRRAATALLAGAFFATPIFAEGTSEETSAEEGPKVIEVQMLNKHPETGQAMSFFPRVIEANVGDTIKFLNSDKGHNAAANKKMLPEGVEAFKGKINKEVEIVVEKAGFYGVECTPHRTVGMVALIVVEGEGKMDNLEDAMGAKHSGKAKKSWAEIWEEAEEKGLLSASEETAS